MARALHQLLAGYAAGDAISNEARTLRDRFRSWGYESDIFCETHRTHPLLRKDARDLASLRAAVHPDSVVLLHLSIGSPANLCFRDLPCRKAIRYHNITPPQYFHLVNSEIAHALETGRKQMALLADCAEINMGVSRYNTEELVAAGYRNPVAIPLLLDLDGSATGPVDRDILSLYNDGRTNILFVGRCAPNKKIEDLLLAFSVFRKAVRPDARLIQVGSFAGVERYHYMLRTLAHEAGISDVVFPGNVPEAQLRAYYAVSHLFLCLSEHEGFCIPLLEAMRHRLPVCAYAAAAVPETLDGAGVCFARKDYPLIAETMGTILTDTTLREAILREQDRRLERYRRRDIAAELREALAPLLQ